jgi:hypothetical protein
VAALRVVLVSYPIALVLLAGLAVIVGGEINQGGHGPAGHRGAAGTGDAMADVRHGAGPGGRRDDRRRLTGRPFPASDRVCP